MNKLIELIEKGKPFFEKISRNKYLRAIRDGFIAGMPVILFSSIFIPVSYTHLDVYKRQICCKCKIIVSCSLKTDTISFLDMVFIFLKKCSKINNLMLTFVRNRCNILSKVRKCFFVKN